jgi:hypothetical protein
VYLVEEAEGLADALRLLVAGARDEDAFVPVLRLERPLPLCSPLPSTSTTNQCEGPLATPPRSNPRSGEGGGGGGIGKGWAKQADVAPGGGRRTWKYFFLFFLPLPSITSRWTKSVMQR